MRKNTICRYVVVVATVVGVAMTGTGALTAANANDFRLLDAAKSEDAQAIRSLVEQGVPVNVKRADGVTPLHWVAQSNDLSLADLLIHAGAQVNAADNYGVTPLALACGNGSNPLVMKLLEAGANPNSAQNVR